LKRGASPLKLFPLATFNGALTVQNRGDYEQAIELCTAYLANNLDAIGALKNRAACFGVVDDSANLERDAERVL
jgi:hypothetical protein